MGYHSKNKNNENKNNENKNNENKNNENNDYKKDKIACAVVVFFILSPILLILGLGKIKEENLKYFKYLSIVIFMYNATLFSSQILKMSN